MGDGRCPVCHASAPQFERALSFGEYEGSLRGLIHLLKYRRVTTVAGPLGAMLSQAIHELLAGADASAPLLVAVPLHKSRRKARGFNQAELLARAAAKQVHPGVEIASGVLIRERDTISQVGLTREERIQNMRGAFRVVDPRRVTGRNVLLIDDVMTTGTTLSECARVLQRAGAEKVWAATVARAFQGTAPNPAADEGSEEETAAAEVFAAV